MRAAWAYFAALALLACAPASPVKSVGEPAESAPLEKMPADAVIVYLIHGAGSYSWHDASGRRRLADAEALAQALEVARQSTRAEVFVFHQRGRRWRWFGADGEMRHFRNGSLVRQSDYFRSEAPGFAAEAALFARHAQPPATGRPAYLVYFGHELPALAAVAGASRFAKHRPRDSKPFSLIVLSACHGGTPATTSALAPFTDYLIASPGELHLSFLDTRALGRSDGLDALALGRLIAEDSFSRLSATTLTGVAVSLYHTETATAYLDTRRGAWDFVGKGYRDCAEDFTFGPGGWYASGAMVFWQPPRFGPMKAKAVHSGWECPDLRPPRLGMLATP